MSIAVSTDARVKDVKITDELITFFLVDGRVVSVPLAWSWRLSEAAPAQRNNFEIIGDGHGVHWPDIDEDPLFRSEGYPARDCVVEHESACASCQRKEELVQVGSQYLVSTEPRISREALHPALGIAPPGRVTTRFVEACRVHCIENAEKSKNLPTTRGQGFCQTGIPALWSRQQ